MNERMRLLREALRNQMSTNTELQARAEASDATEEERAAWAEGLTAAERIAGDIENEDRFAKLQATYGMSTGEERFEDANENRADESGTFGDRIVRSFQAGLGNVRRGVDRFALSAETEFRAPTTTDGVTNPQTVGVVTIPLMRPTVASLLLPGSLTGDSVKVYRELAVTGGPAATAEDGLKPELSGGFDELVVPIGKVAGHTKHSDELAEDFPQLKSVVEGRLVTRLVLAEEQQLLNGDGTGANLTGILNTSGIQVQAQGTDSVADAIFKATTKIQTATYMNADFIVMHPGDYEKLRLAVDGNGQYFGGGFFAGQYGNGGVPTAPGLWGLSTVITPAIAAGTVLVGSGQAAQVFRKGGIRVDIANQNEDDFVHDRVTIRAEVRELLAVYYPQAFAKVTLGA